MSARRSAEDDAVGEPNSKKARIGIPLPNDEPEENGYGRPSERASSVFPVFNGRSSNGNGPSEGTSVAEIPPTGQGNGKGKGRQLDFEGTSSTTGSDSNPAGVPWTDLDILNKLAKTLPGQATALGIIKSRIQDAETGPSTAGATTSTVPTSPASHPLPGRDDPEAAHNPPPFTSSSSSADTTIFDLFRQDFLDRETTKEDILALVGDDMKTIVRKQINVLKCLHFGRPLAPVLGIGSDDLRTDSEGESEEDAEAEGVVPSMEATRTELRQIEARSGEEREKTVERTQEKTLEIKQEQTNEETNGQTNGTTNEWEKEQAAEPTRESILANEQVREEIELRAMEEMNSDELQAFFRWKDRKLELPPFDPIKDRKREARETDKDLKPKRARKLVALNRLYRVASGTYDLANLELFETTHSLQLWSELLALTRFIATETAVVAQFLDAEKQFLSAKNQFHAAERQKKFALARILAAEKRRKLALDRTLSAAERRGQLERDYLAHAAAERQKQLDMVQARPVATAADTASAAASAAADTVSASASKATSTAPARPKRPKKGTEEEQKEILALHTLGFGFRDAERAANIGYIDLQQRSARANGVMAEFWKAKHEKVWGHED
ncbi:unnamed protein product [Tilletia controversa]|nr:unnamed protein product [Tilletia controversa]CAD6947236.1 unnamed protein product [Tilletia controversa]